MTAVAAMPMRLDTFGMSPPATPTSESSPSQIFRQHASGKGGSLEDLLKEEVKFEVMPGGLGSGGFEKYEKQLATPVQAKKVCVGIATPAWLIPPAARDPAHTVVSKARDRRSGFISTGCVSANAGRIIVILKRSADPLRRYLEPELAG